MRGLKLTQEQINQISTLKTEGKTYNQIKELTGRSFGVIYKYTHVPSQARRLYNKLDDNKLVRYLDKKDLTRIRRGKDVKMQVNKTIVVLRLKGSNDAKLRSIDRKIAILMNLKKEMSNANGKNSE